jgi:hypothetical protein
MSKKLNRNGRRCFWVISASVAIAFGASAATEKNSAALRCGVDAGKAAQRFFADPNGQNAWREYRSLKDVPDTKPGFGRIARLWAGSRNGVLIRLEEANDDFGSSTDYCFDRTGRLVTLRFELRTAWGWGFREEGPVVNGAVAPRVSQFFSTNNEAPIARPEQADDVAEALRPDVYVRESRLPFARLLAK